MDTRIERKDQRDGAASAPQYPNPSQDIAQQTAVPEHHHSRLKLLVVILVILGLIIVVISGRLAVLAASRTRNNPGRTASTAVAAAPVVDEASPRAPKFPALRVEAINYRGDKSTAVINGQTLQLGDSLQDVTIVAITPSTVTVSMNGRVKVLTNR